GEELSERRVPVFSFGVLLVSVVFVLASGPINDFIRGTLRVNVPQEVIRPNWYTTVAVAKDVFHKDPVLGIGPNRFLNAWASYKPAGVNSTDAWGIDFGGGIGLVPTFVITTGLLGGILWVIFLGAFLYVGAKAMFKRNIDKPSHYLLASSFLGSLYLWVMMVFYVPNIVIAGLAFIITGVFIATLITGGIIKNYDFSFLENPRVGFVSVLMLILFIIASIAGGYFVVEKFLSLVSYQKGIVLSAQGDVLGARTALEHANKLHESDVYFRALSEVNTNSLRVILDQKDISEETIKAQFQLASRESINYAVKATQFDQSNYINWIALARAYGALILFGAPTEFYESAKKNFEEAIARNHTNPALYLELARLELLNKDPLAAKQYIGKALTMKNDYVEAIFLLAQIQADEGDLKNAITSSEVASLISPNDVGVFFQLGLLRYKNSDYAGAISALERAIELNPSYANAKYFLGISYSKLGRVAEAIRQFEDIKLTNPDNLEVQTILHNLRTSGNALAPEKRDTPPIKEKKR
ncbi:MAG: tetratricopeptide repeat protein, partial [Minisyncoccota bacterium]